MHQVDLAALFAVIPYRGVGGGGGGARAVWGVGGGVRTKGMGLGWVSAPSGGHGPWSRLPSLPD